jgi:predicted XRE-type DNA-binding protein
MVAKLKAKTLKKSAPAKKPVAKKLVKKAVEPKGKIGSSFEDFLKDEGNYEAVTALAVKRVLAWQIEEAMKGKRMSKASLASKMKTSRSQLDRLLDPDNEKVQLDTIHRAALAVGKKVVISLEDIPA